MDNKRLFIAIAVGLALIVGYMLFLPWLDKQMGWDKPNQQQSTAPATQATQPATQAATTVANASQPVLTTAPATGPTIWASAEVRAIPATQPGAAPAPASIGLPNPNDGQFALQLNLRAQGAGIDSVVLNTFKKAGKNDERYSMQQVPSERLDMQALATRSITVNGTNYDSLGLQWALIEKRPDKAVYSAELLADGKPLLSIRKTYQVAPRSDPSLGYEIRVDYAFQNRTATPLTIKTSFNGPALPPPESDTASDLQLIGGIRLDKDRIDLDVHALSELSPDKDNGELDLTKDSKGRPALWVGTASNYFGAELLPHPLSGEKGDPTYIAKIQAHGVNIEHTTPLEERNAFITIETHELKVAPGGSLTMPLSVFFGPKWRQVLDVPHYTAYPRQYNLLLIIRGMCGMSWCTFGWLVDAIIALLKGMHFLFRDWGLAIIGLVAIVRVLLHPITKRSQISMAKMSKMGPEMKRLQEKYKDDKEALNKAMLEFHKQQGLGPYLGCLPMFLQMPIWVALYGVLQTTFELRQAPFLWNLTWIHDLSQPDRLISLAHAVHPLAWAPFEWMQAIEFHGLNLVPVLLAVVMAIQQQFMKPPTAATPEQMQQQKMMMWLSPVMFLFFFYSLPSGLNLYIFTSTAVGIVESKIVRDHIKAREEAEKAGKVFVETKPTRGSKRSKGQGDGAAKKPAGVWGRVLEWAEQLRQQQERDRRRQ